MKKITAVFLVVIMLTCSFAWAETAVHAEGTNMSEADSVSTPNLWADIAVADFGTNDQSPTTADFGFTEQTEPTYGTKYKVTHSYYTTFYVKLPELEANTEYYLSFKYDNDIATGHAGSIAKMHIIDDAQFQSVDENGKVTAEDAILLGKNVTLDNGEWTMFTSYFTTSDSGNYYLNIQTDYAYNLYLCDFELRKTVERPVTVVGGTSDKENAKIGETVTINAAPTSDQKFMGWEVTSGDVVLADAESAATTFTMPDTTVSIKAEYYENLWLGIDRSYFEWADLSMSESEDDTYGTIFTVTGNSESSFFSVKMPTLEKGEEYNLGVRCNVGENAIIKKICVLTDEQLSEMNAQDYAIPETAKMIVEDIELDKDEWRNITYSFTTENEETSYYLCFIIDENQTLNLCDFKLTKNFSEGITVTGGRADNPFALQGEQVILIADDTEEKEFSYWKVVSGGVTIKNPYSTTATFEMGNMAVKVQAVYLESDIEIVYSDIDGEHYANAISAIHKTKLTDNHDGTFTAEIDFYSYDGAYIFGGWYDGDKCLSTDIKYTYIANEVSELVAKVITLNVIDGDPGFEDYNTGDTVRVEPEKSGVLPYNNRWGIWCRYSAEVTDYKIGYENPDWDYSIKTYRGTTTDYYRNYTYSAATATYTLDGTKTEYKVTPYSGDTMLGAMVKSRSMVRKLQNLEPNTEYTISFYVNNPSQTDLLSTIVVANTYDLDAGNVLDATGDGIYGYFEDYDGLSDSDKTRQWGRMNLTFTTGDDTDSVYLHFGFSTKNSRTDESRVYIDDLVCVPAIVSLAGHEIREASSELPQALRYKFLVDNDILENFHEMEVGEIGLLAIEKEVLKGEELVLDGKYTFNGSVKSPRVGIVTSDKIKSVAGDDTHSYFTAALYNIGVTDGVVDYNKYISDYTVRAYFKLEIAAGEEIVLYSAPMNTSIFDIVKEIYTSKDNDDARKIADGIMSISSAKAVYNNWETKEDFFITKETVTDYDFSIAVVGDPQKTVGFHPEYMRYTYDWIVENASSKNIQHVITLGDIVETDTNTTEYDTITAELDKIEKAEIAQSIVRGNHDKDNFDVYITQEKYGAFLNDSSTSGAYDDTMRNVYQIVTMGEIKYLMLTLEYYPSNAVVDWAAGIVAANPDCKVIISTHGLLQLNMTNINNSYITYLHENLIMKYSNISLVLCGHNVPYEDDGPVYKTITGDNGNTIIEMMINPQGIEEEKDDAFGFVAMLYFGNDTQTVTVEWYSTVRKAFYKDKYQFTFTMP